MRGCWVKVEGMETERLEEKTRVVLKPLEAMCLHSSMHGRRWPSPKKGATQISFDIFGWLWSGIFYFERHLCSRSFIEETRRRMLAYEENEFEERERDTGGTGFD
jgi:hypothetical protein